MHYLLIKIQLLWAKHTKWLDRNPVKVPVSKRVIAYAIDWAVGGIISLPDTAIILKQEFSCCFILWGSYW